MKGNKMIKGNNTKKKIATSLFLVSSSVGAMFVADNMNIENIVDEYSLISEMTNKTLNISFVPNNPYMKDNVKLFNPITQSDIDNIAKIQGVKSVKPIDTEVNPLSGYLKVDSKSSYIELYGMNENGQDNNNIEMIYGRAINTNDRGKNVIVLNIETVNALQVIDPKSLIGTGVEINNAVYEVIGIMNVVMEDERDNTSELENTSLIPKSTSKEILARANATNSVYSAITVSVEDNANSSTVETAIYNHLYQQHEGINGYYEKDVDYNLSKKLDPTLSMLENFVKYIKVSSISMFILSLAALIKSFIKTKDEYELSLEEENLEDDNQAEDLNVETEEYSDILNQEDSDNDSAIEEVDNQVEVSNEDEGNVENADDNENNSEDESVENSDSLNEEDNNIEEENEDEHVKVDKDAIATKKKSHLLESNKDNILVIIIAGMLSVAFTKYYLSGKSIDSLIDVSIVLKVIIAIISAYLIKVSKR